MPALRAAVAVLTLAASLVSAVPAAAHGRAPYVERIAFDPSDPSRIVLQFSFGLVISEDGGASWRWVCAAAFGADSSWEDPDVVVTAEGALLIGTYEAVVRAPRDLCEFERPGGSVHDVEVIDLALDPGDDRTIWALTSPGGGQPESLQRSSDGGRGWARVGTPLEALLESMALAPSDPERVYVTAMMPATADAPRRALLYRSSDRGETLAPVEIELLAGEQAPVLLGVDPTDADRLFVRMRRSVTERRPERLLVSDDVGLTFRTAIELPQILGFAMSPDGRTVWVGAAQADGVWIARDGTLDFAQVNALDVRCLAVRDGELWMCVDQLTHGFALGRSRDDGATWEPLLYLDRLEELPVCPLCSTTGVTCPLWVDDLRYDLARYLGAGSGWVPHDASIPPECLDGGVRSSLDGGIVASMDAGLSRADGGPPPASSGGCGCRAAGGVPLGRACFLALAVLPVLALRHRRR